MAISDTRLLAEMQAESKPACYVAVQQGSLYSKTMKTIGERVRARREELNLSQSALGKAAGGVSYQAIQQLEAGGGTKHLVAIARALRVSADWLQTGSGEKELTSQNSTSGAVQNDASVTSNARIAFDAPGRSEGAQNQRLAILGMAEGGPDGWSLFNGDLIETVPMPANLVGVKGAYGVYVVGDSMSPRYRPGEIAHIHPHKPLTIGAYVLVQKRPKAPGEPPLAVIKELVRRSGSKIVLAQINPPKTFELRTDEIVSIHRVVGSAEA